MGAYVNGMATAALVTGTLIAWVFAQPGPNQGQSKTVLTQARRSGEQPGVAALGQQLFGLSRNPGS
jgi:hypothetical protein